MGFLQFTTIAVVTFVVLYPRGAEGYRIQETDPKYGISVEVLDDPIFYNTFVPIIYEFKLPEGKASDLRVKWPAGNSNQCDRSEAWNWSWDSQACPVVYHYNKLIDSVLRNITEAWKGNTFTESKSNLKWDWGLDEIAPHFKGRNLNDAELEDYIEYFGKHQFKKPVVSKDISEYVDIDKEVYEKMLGNFRKNSMASIAREGSLNINSPLLYTQFAVLTNSYTAIQAMQILNYYMMIRNRWSDAFYTCKNFQIPQPIVPQNVLLQSLEKIRSQISENQKVEYQLSVSVEELAAYYHLKLTDCAFTTRNTFIVRILVPIRKVHSNEILLRVNAIPFIRKEGTRTEICQLANVEGQFISRNDKMNMLNTNYCNSNDICKIPDRSEWTVANSCLSAILSKNESEVDLFCSTQWQCKTYLESNGPYFKRIASHKFAIAGNLSENHQDVFVLLTCTKNPHKIIKGENYGTVIVAVPCDCVLIYVFDTWTGNSQCNKTLQFHHSKDIHVIPYLWEKNKSAYTVNTNTTFIVEDLIVSSTEEASRENYLENNSDGSHSFEDEQQFQSDKDTTVIIKRCVLNNEVSSVNEIEIQELYYFSHILMVANAVLIILSVGLYILLTRLSLKVRKLDNQTVTVTDRQQFQGTIPTSSQLPSANNLETIVDVPQDDSSPRGYFQQIKDLFSGIFAIFGGN